VPGRDELLARAAALEARFSTLGLKARQWLRMVRPYRAPEVEPETAPEMAPEIAPEIAP